MWTRISASIGFLGVALGAFGAHGMEKRLEAAGRVETWDTAVLYHLIHAVVLFCLSWKQTDVPKGPWYSMAIGILLFSGSLYFVCITGITEIVVLITPLGGLAFLIGWGWLVYRGK